MSGDDILYGTPKILLIGPSLELNAKLYYQREEKEIADCVNS